MVSKLVVILAGLITLAPYIIHARLPGKKDSISPQEHISSREHVGSKKSKTLNLLNDYVFDDPHLKYKNNLIVHLLEWSWPAIEKECKNYLSKHGIGAVQVSPVTEHIFDIKNVNGKKDLPWYVRYQPVSYILDSRSGTEEEFIRMVQQCNKVGVRIIVDVVINHMASVGYSYINNNTNNNVSYYPRSSHFSNFVGHSFHEQFPTRNGCKSYNSNHFHDKKCDGDIQNFDNRIEAQTCRLVSLADLEHEDPEVQEIIACFLNYLISIGVAGFRVDASRHMAAKNLGQIFKRLDYLRKDMFGSEKLPFIAHEIIDHGDSVNTHNPNVSSNPDDPVDPNSPVTLFEYLSLGRAINFNYHPTCTNAIRNHDHKSAVDLLRIRENSFYGNTASHNVLNFLDNHDTQRYEHEHLITHKNPWEYRIAASFLLASTYGVPRLISSYNFEDKDQGPPNKGAPEYKLADPEFNNNLKAGGCTNGYICEHRWPELRRMISFRSNAADSAMALISIAHSNCFGFARLQQGYFALNNDRNNECTLNNVDTSLPDGVYCNLFYQDADEECKDRNKVTVKNGKATIKIDKFSIFAFNLQSRISKSGSKSGQPLQNKSEESTKWSHHKETVIFVNKEVPLGKYLFIRGGRKGQYNDCDKRPDENNKCAIPIQHSLSTGPDESPSMVHESYRLWRQMDRYLDFHGAEHAQGTVNAAPADGTPLIYTTNDSKDPTFNKLNHHYKLGPNHWMVSIRLDCSANPTFLVKAFLDNNWEPGNNHEVRCGKVNVITWGKGDAKSF